MSCYNIDYYALNIYIYQKSTNFQILRSIKRNKETLAAAGRTNRHS